MKLKLLFVLYTFFFIPLLADEKPELPMGMFEFQTDIQRLHTELINKDAQACNRAIKTLSMTFAKKIFELSEEVDTPDMQAFGDHLWAIAEMVDEGRFRDAEFELQALLESFFTILNHYEAEVNPVVEYYTRELRTALAKTESEEQYKLCLRIILKEKPLRYSLAATEFPTYLRLKDLYLEAKDPGEQTELAKELLMHFESCKGQ